MWWIWTSNFLFLQMQHVWSASYRSLVATLAGIGARGGCTKSAELYYGNKHTTAIRRGLQYEGRWEKKGLSATFVSLFPNRPIASLCRASTTRLPSTSRYPM